MENLVFTGQNGQAMTTSLLVAEKFGKEHKNVIRSIRDLLQSAQNCADYFREVEFEDNRGRKQPMYLMNRDGFTLLAMGFTGPKALEFKMEFLNAFNIMEAMLKSDDYILARSREILESRLQASQQRIQMLEAENETAQKQIEEQQSKIEQDAPKVLFADAVSTSQRSCLVAELAKILKQNGVDIGQNRLYGWLRSNGYLGARGLYYNQPTQKSMKLGLFEIKQTTITKPDGTVLVATTPKITGKGQIYFVDKFLSRKGGASC